MAAQSTKFLGLFRKHNVFDKGMMARLPEAYKKFYKEWKLTPPTAVHYIPEEGIYKRNEVTGEVSPIQNTPIPVKIPKEAHNHIWGGEGVIQGFQKRTPYKRRVPHFWVPILKRSVVYSEILDKYISVVITDRAINLINSSYGFDHYILKTPACDLGTLLPLRLKRKMLEALQNNCPAYNEKPEKQKEVIGKYNQYLSAYTPDEIEWYGYSIEEACKKMEKVIELESRPVPLKQIYRAELIEQLKMAKLEAAKEDDVEITETTSWMQRINPFGKKHET